VIDELKPYPAMKDSGVPWLGEVPEHWEIQRGKTLFRSVDVRSESGLEELLTVSSNHGVVPRRTASVTMFKAESYVGHKLCWPGDLVINSLWAWSRGLGVSRHHGIVSSAYGVFRCRDTNALEPRFVDELVRSSPFHWELRVRSKGVWTSRLQLTDESFLGAPFPLPPLPEQAAIFRFLDHADRKIRRYIRAKQKLIMLLEEQKQAIIHRAVARGLDPNVRLKPSGVEWLGDIPEHWEVWRISRFATVGNGSTPSRGESKYWSPSDYPWLNSSQINRGLIDSADQFVSMLALHDCHLPKVTPGSILVAITGQGRTRGKSAILGIEATINQHIAYLSLRLQIASPEFVNLVLTAAYTHLRKISDDSGSTKGALTCEDLKHLKIPIPPHGEQRVLLARTQSAITETINTISRLEREITLLREYRTRLIADVVTGKLDVREAAAQLPVEEQELQLVDELDDTNETEEDTLDDLDGSPEEAET
jgi:type I restriction enzyme S subunit